MFTQSVLISYCSGDQLSHGIHVQHISIHMKKYLSLDAFRMGWLSTVDNSETSFWEQALTDIWRWKQKLSVFVILLVSIWMKTLKIWDLSGERQFIHVLTQYKQAVALNSLHCPTFAPALRTLFSQVHIYNAWLKEKWEVGFQKIQVWFAGSEKILVRLNVGLSEIRTLENWKFKMSCKLPSDALSYFLFGEVQYSSHFSKIWVHSSKKII